MNINIELKRIATRISSLSVPKKPLNQIFTNTSTVKKISDLIPTEEIGKEISYEKFKRGESHFDSGQKRKPIMVKKSGDKFKIIDGNTTFYILKALGYTEIPVTVKNSSYNVKTAMEFDTKEALDKYLEEHPGADKTLHHVKPQKQVSPINETQHIGIMRPDFEKLPDAAMQPNVKGPDDFYAQAQESHKEMTKLLDQGQGLDVKIGAKVILPKSDEEFAKSLETDKPVIIIGSIKGKERAAEKVNADYGGDWSKLKDGVRATVSVKKISDLSRVFSQLEELGMKLAQKPKDRYIKPTVSGYRDILLNVQYPNGHIGELQINCHDMIKAKMNGHKIYEQARSVEAKAKQEGRDYMTDEELAIVADANRRMKSLYENAYQQSLKG